LEFLDADALFVGLAEQHILEGELLGIVSPCVRQDSVGRRLVVIEFSDLERVNVEETHDREV
jgi:hypothetical protein